MTDSAPSFFTPPTGADLEMLWLRQEALQKQFDQLVQRADAEVWASGIIQLSLISLIFGREIATAAEVTDRIDQMQKNLAKKDSRAGRQQVSDVLAYFKEAAINWSNPNRPPEPAKPQFTVITNDHGK